ncbi:heme-dependent oxidative N-demethylase subunit alpha family protein [Cypionkella sp. TWP1-2-1b2]|uniref:heme-dependent oxidative N-demethylase subunit alpha family protein n=1 Tax=Cypionkella sp. TWP1-2-1b2 TaxID=2804675 RepID=UPI003CFAF776
MSAVLHVRPVGASWAGPRSRRLTEMQLFDPANWLRVDKACAKQIVVRLRMMMARSEAVHLLDPNPLSASSEICCTVLSGLPRPDFVARETFSRSESIVVRPIPNEPLPTQGGFYQNDFFLSENRNDEHVLTNANFCLLGCWALPETPARSPLHIRKPVAGTRDIAWRVNRLFGEIRLGILMLRAAWLIYVHVDLHHTLFEALPSGPSSDGSAYIAFERQCIGRPPEIKNSRFQPTLTPWQLTS